MEGTIGVVLSMGMITVCTFLVGFIFGRESMAKNVQHFFYQKSDMETLENVNIPEFMEKPND